MYHEWRSWISPKRVPGLWFEGPGYLEIENLELLFYGEYDVVQKYTWADKTFLLYGILSYIHLLSDFLNISSFVIMQECNTCDLLFVHVLVGVMCTLILSQNEV